MNGQVPRVAVLADWWWPDTVGGAERSARAAALELARFAEVAIFVPAGTTKVYRDGPLTVHAVRRPFARREHGDSAARRGLEFLTAWLYPPVARSLARAVRQFEPDVTVATNVSRTGPWLIRRVKASGSGFVRTFHDLSDTCWRRSRLKAGSSCTTICRECRVKARIMRSAPPAAAVSVCVSGFVRDELVSAGLTTSRASLVAYPVVGATGGGTPAPRRRTPRPPGAGGPVIGYIGRIDPVKGVDSAIRTAGAYRRATGQPVAMVVAGEGRAEYLRSLAELAAAESVEVDFTGQLDIDEFCARVDVVLIPSTWMEPFGRVAVEVGDRGLPMLVSPVGGLPEAAEVSGGRFAFADFAQPETAAVALLDLMTAGTASRRPVTPPGETVPFPQGVVLAVRSVLGERVESRR